MTPEKRDELDNVVREDLTTIVGSIDFATKRHTTDPVVSHTVSVASVGWAPILDLSAGLAWMAAAPPENAGNVVVRNGESSVGVLLVRDIRQGDQVSGTIVPLPLDGHHDGLRLRDPSGQIHPSRPGGPSPSLSMTRP